MKRHNCGQGMNKNSWQTCVTCKVRIHLEGCTTKKDPKKDCCLQRHINFYKRGHKWGLCDSSKPMLTNEEIQKRGLKECYPKLF